MVELPRIAIGTVQAQADPALMAWALMETLARRELRVQSFLSHAYFCPRDGATAITGSPARHLDSWLMTPEVCREVFTRGARAGDLALVEGHFDNDPGAGDTPESSLSTLCEWLDLPRLAVIDARRLSACQMPERPATVDGVLFDRVHDAIEYCRLRTQFEALWKVPVLGWLPELARVREALDRVDCGRQPPLELCQTLGDEFSKTVQVEALLKLAAQRWFDEAEEPAATRSNRHDPLRVAVAYDDVFGGYFPDTLDLLESRGAAICDFSPLHDERLPPDTDVVYFGCGHPEKFARELSRNDCLMLSLKSHVSSGKRIYAECGGLAYLCQEIELADGERLPLAGVIPATAHFDPTPGVPLATEVHLADDTWLGGKGECWRGYLGRHWNLSPAPQLEPCADGPEQPWNLVKRNQAIGSRVYLNFAAHAGLVERFFTPCPARQLAPH